MHIILLLHPQLASRIVTVDWVLDISSCSACSPLSMVSASRARLRSTLLEVLYGPQAERTVTASFQGVKLILTSLLRVQEEPEASRVDAYICVKADWATLVVALAKTPIRKKCGGCHADLAL